MTSPNRLLTSFAVLLIGGAAFASYSSLATPQETPQASQEHEIVTKGAGEWHGTIKMWMPGMPDPTESPCSETVTAIGELWTVSHFTSNMMGASFQGSAILGYDASKKKFVGSWIDSMTTAITPTEGVWDAAKKAIVMTYDVNAGGVATKMRSETIQDGDNYTCTFFDVTGGGERRQMEISMKRRTTMEAGAAK